MTEKLPEQNQNPEKEIREEAAEALANPENLEKLNTDRLFSELILDQNPASEQIRKQLIECSQGFPELFDSWQAELEKIADEFQTGEGRVRKSVSEAHLFLELGNYAEALDRLDNDALMQADQMGFDDLGDEIYKLIKLIKAKLGQK